MIDKTEEERRRVEAGPGCVALHYRPDPRAAAEKRRKEVLADGYSETDAFAASLDAFLAAKVVNER